MSSEIRYVVRFFHDNQYTYSIHCTANVLDRMIRDAHERGYTVKVVAYESDDELNSEK